MKSEHTTMWLFANFSNLFWHFKSLYLIWQLWQLRVVIKVNWPQITFINKMLSSWFCQVEWVGYGQRKKVFFINLPELEILVDFVGKSIVLNSQIGRNWSSRPELFCKKVILRNFAKYTGKHLCQSLFLN